MEVGFAIDICHDWNHGCDRKVIEVRVFLCTDRDDDCHHDDDEISGNTDRVFHRGRDHRKA